MDPVLCVVFPFFPFFFSFKLYGFFFSRFVLKKKRKNIWTLPSPFSPLFRGALSCGSPFFFFFFLSPLVVVNLAVIP